jgi:hypothetical protein
MGTGQVSFDDYFAPGGTTHDKIRAMNAWANSHGGKPSPAVVFDTKEYVTAEPIGWTSGLTMVGGAGSGSREYGRRTVIRYTGAAGTSLFRFGVVQTNQGYPSDGSPRDVNITGIEFRGGTGVDWCESFASSESYRGRTLWYCNFHNCGWNGWRRIWWGWATGSTIDGVTHCQAFSDTAFDVGGSENVLFGNDAHSFMDSRAAGIVGKPMIRSRLSKSVIGTMMVTTRKNILALLIDYGHGLTVKGFKADSQDSDPCYGANIRIAGSAQVTLQNAILKGHMTNPTAAAGGEPLNRGIIHVDNCAELIVDGCTFLRRGNSVPSPDTPLIYTGPNVPTAAVRIGLNAHAGYSGLVRAARAGQIISTDPTIRVAP